MSVLKIWTLLSGVGPQNYGNVSEIHKAVICKNVSENCMKYERESAVCGPVGLHSRLNIVQYRGSLTPYLYYVDAGVEFDRTADSLGHILPRPHTR